MSMSRNAKSADNIFVIVKTRTLPAYAKAAQLVLRNCLSLWFSPISKTSRFLNREFSIFDENQESDKKRNVDLKKSSNKPRSLIALIALFALPYHSLLSRHHS